MVNPALHKGDIKGIPIKGIIIPDFTTVSVYNERDPHSAYMCGRKDRYVLHGAKKLVNLHSPLAACQRSGSTSRIGSSAVEQNRNGRAGTTRKGCLPHISHHGRSNQSDAGAPDGDCSSWSDHGIVFLPL